MTSRSLVVGRVPTPLELFRCRQPRIADSGAQLAFIYVEAAVRLFK